MEPPVTVNTSGSYGSSPDSAGATSETPHCVGSSSGMSVVPCKDPCSLLHLPELPMLKVLGYLSFRDILATAKTCTYLNQVISSEHLLAKRWFATLPAHRRNQFKVIARHISNPDLQNWLGQFTKDATVADKLCSQAPAEQTTDDDRKTGEAQKGKYFPQALFYTVGQLMVGCRQFEPVLEKRIIDGPKVLKVSISTRGDHLVIYRDCSGNSDPGKGTCEIFGCTGSGQWNKQAGFSYHSWVNLHPPIGSTHMSTFIIRSRRVLTWDEDHTAKIFAYNPDHTFTEQFTIFYEGKIISADLSRDGHHVVITCDDGSAKIHSWHDTGHWKLTADIADGRRWTADFSPDSSRVLTHSNSCARIHMRNEEGGWTLEAATTSSSWTLGNSHSKVVKFGPNGSHVLMFGYMGIAKILCLNKDGGWLESPPLGNNEGPVLQAIASPNGRHVIIISDQFTKVPKTRPMKIFSRDSNGNWTKKADNILIYNGYTKLSSKFSPDSCHVMVAKDPSNVEILSCDKHGNWIPTSIPLEGDIKAAFFSPDSSHAVVVAYGYPATIYGYNASRGWIKKHIIRHKLSCITAEFSANSRHIVTFSNGAYRPKGEYQAKIHSRDKNDIWRLTAIIPHTRDISSASFNDDSSHIVIAIRDGTAIILGQYADGNWVNKAILKHAHPVRTAIFSVDSRQVVTISGRNTVQIWRLAASGIALDSPPGTQ